MNRLLTLLIMLLAWPSLALAQSGPVEVKFVGTITASAPDTLMIRGAGGVMTPWTGPLPDFPYVAGDQITVSLNVLPSGEYLDPNYPSKPVDGIYRFSVTGRSQGIFSTTGVAPIRSMDVSGPIGPSGQWESATGLLLTYNANTGAWGMEMPKGTYTLSEFDGPGYLYDRTTNSMSLTNTTAEPVYRCGEPGAGCFNVTGNMTSGAINRAPVWGTDGSLAGFFSMLFSGDWFVNGVKQGGATEVPEPGQTGLFAMALIAVMLRRRQRVTVPTI